MLLYMYILKCKPIFSRKQSLKVNFRGFERHLVPLCTSFELACLMSYTDLYFNSCSALFKLFTHCLSVQGVKLEHKHELKCDTENFSFGSWVADQVCFANAHALLILSTILSCTILMGVYY